MFLGRKNTRLALSKSQHCDVHGNRMLHAADAVLCSDCLYV